MRRDPLAENVNSSDAHLICAVSIAGRVCGAEAAKSLVRDFAGTRIHIPKVVPPDHPLSKSLGHKHAAALAAECGGVPSYIPISCSGRANRRRALVHHLIGEGKTVPEIARATGHSERAIHRDIQMLRLEGVKIDRKRNLGRKRKTPQDDHNS